MGHKSAQGLSTQVGVRYSFDNLLHQVRGSGIFQLSIEELVTPGSRRVTCNTCGTQLTCTPIGTSSSKQERPLQVENDYQNHHNVASHSFLIDLAEEVL